MEKALNQFKDLLVKEMAKKGWVLNEEDSSIEDWGYEWEATIAFTKGKRKFSFDMFPVKKGDKESGYYTLSGTDFEKMVEMDTRRKLCVNAHIINTTPKEWKKIMSKVEIYENLKEED